MNKTDELWQRVLDEEKNRWIKRPVEELFALEQDSIHKLKIREKEIEYLLIHEKPDEFLQIDNHSFILRATRKLLPIGIAYRNYYSGFSLNGAGKIILLSDNVIGRYD